MGNQMQERISKESARCEAQDNFQDPFFFFSVVQWNEEKDEKWKYANG